jgi:hypothetical protein
MNSFCKYVGVYVISYILRRLAATYRASEDGVLISHDLSNHRPYDTHRSVTVPARCKKTK